jgi:glutamate-1-semialdehyde 2,1-aminomutase
MSYSIDRFIATHRKSQALWERSLKVSRGIHHDARFVNPFDIFIERGNGTHKWDVDDNEYLDYVMGHGSLLLGHCHPSLVQALSDQIAKGTHYGTEHELAIEWAELVTKLIPAAEKVEFCATGTEAVLIAVQLARAYTGRYKILKFARHFHGWSDSMLVGFSAPHDKPLPGQLPPLADGAVSGATYAIPCNDIRALEEALATREFAAFFIEGGGASGGTICIPDDVIHKARSLTNKYGTVFVIDEVISGFRWAPGGYQSIVGVNPDLCTLGKILAGGVGGGSAVCGSSDIMKLLELKSNDAEWNRWRHISHMGTWNANPLVATAGIAMLREVAKGKIHHRATSTAKKLMDSFQHQIDKRGIEGCAFNTHSTIHLHFGPCQKCDRSRCLDAQKIPSGEVINTLNLQLLINGVHILKGVQGWVSAVHTDEEVLQTTEAFGKVLDGMIDEGVFEKKP